MKKRFRVNFKIKKDTYCSCCDDYHTHAVVKDKGFTSYVCLNCHYKTGSDYHAYSCPKCHTKSSRSEYGDICLLGKDKCDKECETVVEDFGFPFTFIKRPCETCEHFVKDEEEYSYVESKDYSHSNTPMGCGDDWTEVHKCLHCGEEYEFTNSSY